MEQERGKQLAATSDGPRATRSPRTGRQARQVAPGCTGRAPPLELEEALALLLSLVSLAASLHRYFGARVALLRWKCPPRGPSAQTRAVAAATSLSEFAPARPRAYTSVLTPCA